MAEANREYKDSIFRKYFNDEKKLKALYSALTDTPCDKIRKIDVKTLENIMYGKLKNDLAFLVNGRLIVIMEHMASFSYNLPTRMLRYYAALLELLIEVSRLYKRALVGIPAPEFYIFYNGTEKLPKEISMKLSDAFLISPDGDCSIELKLKLININYDSEHELLEKCTYVKEYATFISKTREYFNEGNSLEEALEKSINYCKKNGIMLNFLQEHGMEVQKMKLGITQEELDEIRREEAYEDGFSAGRAEGGAEEKLKIARNFKASGIPIDVIAENTGLSEEEVKRL